MDFLITFLYFPIRMKEGERFARRLRGINGNCFQVIPNRVGPIINTIAFSANDDRHRYLSLCYRFLIRETFFPFLRITGRTRPNHVLNLLRIRRVIIKFGKLRARGLGRHTNFLTRIRAYLGSFHIIRGRRNAKLRMI